MKYFFAIIAAALAVFCSSCATVHLGKLGGDW